MYICCSGLELCFSKGQESTSIQGYCVMLFGPKDPKSTSIDGIQYSPCTNDTLLFLSKRSRNAHLGSHGHPCCSLQEVCHSQLLPLWQRRFDVVRAAETSTSWQHLVKSIMRIRNYGGTGPNDLQACVLCYIFDFVWICLTGFCCSDLWWYQEVCIYQSIHSFFWGMFLKHIRKADVSAVQCSALYCCQKPHVRRILGKRAGAWSSRHARMPCVECIQRLLGWQGISPCYLSFFSWPSNWQAAGKPMKELLARWLGEPVLGHQRLVLSRARRAERFKPPTWKADPATML